MVRELFLDVSIKNCGWYYNKRHNGTIKQNKDNKLLLEELLSICKDRKIDVIYIEAPLLDVGTQQFKNAKITRAVMMFIGHIYGSLKDLDKNVKFIEANEHQKYTIGVGTKELLPMTTLKRKAIRDDRMVDYSASEQRKDLTMFIFANYHNKIDDFDEHTADAFSLYFYKNQRKEYYSVLKSAYKNILKF